MCICQTTPKSTVRLWGSPGWLVDMSTMLRPSKSHVVLGITPIIRLVQCLQLILRVVEFGWLMFNTDTERTRRIIRRRDSRLNVIGRWECASTIPLFTSYTVNRYCLYMYVEWAYPWVEWMPRSMLTWWAIKFSRPPTIEYDSLSSSSANHPSNSR